MSRPHPDGAEAPRRGPMQPSLRPILPACALAALGCAKHGALPVVDDTDDVFKRAHIATKAHVEPAPYMELRGEVQVPMAGLRFPVVVQSSAPLDTLTTAEVPGLGTIIDGYVGGRAFEFNPLVGARLKDAEEAMQAALDADPLPWSEPDRRYTSRRLAGRAPYAGVECHVVEATLWAGGSERLYFGVEDGLPRGSERQVLTAMGPVQTRFEYYDYAELCRGYPAPSRVVSHTGPLSQEMHIQTCQTEALPRVLPIPAAVQQLIDIQVKIEAEAASAPPTDGNGHVIDDEEGCKH